MKSKILWIFLAIVLLGGFSTPGPTKSAEPIIIGVPTSLYTPFGRDGLNAVNLAVEEINAKGGVSVAGVKRPFKVVTADTRGGEPGTPVHDALMAYEKLILDKKPHAIVIGAFRSEVLIASMDLVAKYRVPQLGTIAQTPGFQGKFKKDPEKYKYLFRVTTDALIDAGYLSAALDSLKKDYGLNRIYLIPQDTLWALGFVGLLRKHCGKTGWEEIGYEPYAAGATDFSPGLTKAKEGKAQVIAMVWDVPLGAGIFCKQWAAMKVPSLIIGFVPPMAAPGAWKTLGKDIGNDIRNGKKTLIAVHCLNNVSGDDKKRINKIFGNMKATDKEVKQVYDLFKKLGSIDYAKNTAVKYCEKAKKALEILPDSNAKQILLELADYSIKREK